MSTVWYCCGCSFGPHNGDLHDACISCGRTKCSLCDEEKLSRRMMASSSHSLQHLPSPYAVAASSLDGSQTFCYKSKSTPSYTELLEDEPRLRPLERGALIHHSASSSSTAIPADGVQSCSDTYMYICCQCDDGPKVYNHQPQCVVCDHNACSACYYVK
ncbi:hypothetical protein N7474_001712 [Penicillium riverlandense]|uniref:uncharacterized protein n=1 Tax=Penicillium riverlandense TaxID=1903569 RepID=UPI0025467851|nr:uncharacterized protein N7474_001712 [Penicillium riverlandense]KAJ5833401.1 hypothetical protein N7474_001712 [Penicillium riverlandense]